MNCPQYQHWLENQTILAPEDERELERHLTVCPDCRHVAHTMLYYEAGVFGLRRVTHSVTDEGAVDKILGAAQMTSRLRPRGSGLQLEQVANVITEPVIRYVTAALMVLVLGLFAFQEVYTQHQLNVLAQTLQARGAAVNLQSGYLGEFIQWRRGGGSALPSGVMDLFPEITAGQAINQVLIKAGENRIPHVWRFRYGKNHAQYQEKFWRQLTR